MLQEFVRPNSLPALACATSCTSNVRIGETRAKVNQSQLLSTMLTKAALALTWTLPDNFQTGTSLRLSRSCDAHRALNATNQPH